MPAASVEVFIASYQFAEHTSQILIFAGIQKAVVGQASSRLPNSNHDPFFDVSLTLGSVLELILSPASELVFSGCPIKSTLRCTSQSN